ncbi:NYN domain-containing protein [Caldichromatium japonicum]|uniref:NYN domain-containing protein n=1 Tax=Caldichromatium japonicum TaxID=2699430 RepID=A0A6G7VEP4_9GAMM|nr:NYN domain-containing protein [Caldichromatium japonicum]QIK38422.1 NYN domain-containing protein [Caldichromatium japonicum]
MMEERKDDVAVFIDFENIYISVREKYKTNPNFEYITDHCAKYGRVVIARAYADWYQFSRVTNALYANGIEPRYVPTYYYSDERDPSPGSAIKNSVDIHLVIDAMRTLYNNPNIQVYVLVTGDRDRDRDFIPLLNTIRRHGKRVVVIGVAKAASSHLAQSADEFVFYHQLAEDIVPQEVKTKDVYDVLVEAVHVARKRKNPVTLSTLKSLMKELLGDFDEGKYTHAQGKHFSRFKDFVREAERRGKVQMLTTGTVNEVFLPAENPYELSSFALPPLEAKAEAKPKEEKRQVSAKGTAEA